ncbi:hypothetical protein [Amycolatopsis sp. NBC_01480]|nr:hypothetical protein [Amycolatopsis sp. NBC_01480]
MSSVTDPDESPIPAADAAAYPAPADATAQDVSPHPARPPPATALTAP